VVPADLHEDYSWAVFVCAECRRSISSPAISPFCWILCPQSPPSLFVRRDLEIRRAGITEVVIFHSSKAELLSYQGNLPFAIAADPEKQLYEQYGVASFPQDKPEGNPIPSGDIWALPAEFLIADTGMVKAVHYGRHVVERWSVDELLSLAQSYRTIRYT
jgi:hypothetical protein